LPRKAREKSNSGIYHIMMRGINRQIIFKDEEDYSKFLQTQHPRPSDTPPTRLHRSLVVENTMLQ